MPILTNILKKAGAQSPSDKKRLSQTKRDKQGGTPARAQSENKKQKSPQKKTGGTSLKGEQAHGAHRVIVRPHISEKSVGQIDMGKYVFEVYDNVNAGAVATAVEKTYGVAVAKVNIVKMPRKKVRMRRSYSTKRRNAKAVVTLKAGHSIEVLPQ